MREDEGEKEGKSQEGEIKGDVLARRMSYCSQISGDFRPLPFAGASKTKEIRTFHDFGFLVYGHNHRENMLSVTWTFCGPKQSLIRRNCSYVL